MGNSSTRGRKSQTKRPVRERGAFRNRGAISYRCNSCGKRIAMIWPTNYAAGWDVVVYAKPVQPVDPQHDPWRETAALWIDCTCGAQHRHDDGLELYRKLTRRADRTVVPLSRRS